MQLPTIRNAERLPIFLKVAQVCAILGVSRQFVHQMLARGDFPSIQIDRIIRIPRDEFFRWLAGRERAKGNVRVRTGAAAAVEEAPTA
jgi:excisionase family DNA binding protein